MNDVGKAATATTTTEIMHVDDVGQGGNDWCEYEVLINKVYFLSAKSIRHTCIGYRLTTISRLLLPPHNLQCETYPNSYPPLKMRACSDWRNLPLLNLPILWYQSRPWQLGRPFT